MSEQDFEYGGKRFKLAKIDAIKQFHIARRVAPILAELLPALQGGFAKKDFEKLSEEENLALIAQFAGPIMNGLSKLSDADADLVLFGLLNAVEVKQSAGWARISNGQILMMQDLALPALLNLAGRAFMFNLADFFAVLPQP